MHEFGFLCEMPGMTPETAVSVFVKKALRSNGMPFDVTAGYDGCIDDPFYSHCPDSAMRNSLSRY